MAFSMGGASADEDEGGGSGTTLADINVTPLVDVMLVLLVIFMVTAPLINSTGVDVNLPQAKSGAVKQDEPENAIISVDPKGNVWIDDRKLSASEFDAKFSAVIKARNPKQVFLRGDEGVPYGTIMHVMDALREAGVTRIGMMTQPPKTAAR